MSTAEATRPESPAPVFAALGDPTRLMLLRRLERGEAQSIVALSSGIHISRQAVTKHLHVLEGAGLVTRRRTGRESRYVLETEPLAAARSYLDEVAARWDEALERLRGHVEGS